MKNEELQLLAKRFAEETANSQNDKDIAYLFATTFLQWLNERYDITKKCPF